MHTSVQEKPLGIVPVSKLLQGTLQRTPNPRPVQVCVCVGGGRLLCLKQGAHESTTSCRSSAEETARPAMPAAPARTPWHFKARMHEILPGKNAGLHPSRLLSGLDPISSVIAAQSLTRTISFAGPFKARRGLYYLLSVQTQMNEQINMC